MENKYELWMFRQNVAKMNCALVSSIDFEVHTSIPLPT